VLVGKALLQGLELGFVGLNNGGVRRRVRIFQLLNLIVEVVEGAAVSILLIGQEGGQATVRGGMECLLVLQELRKLFPKGGKAEMR